MKNNPTKLIVHHSADISQSSQLTKINEWHKHIEFPMSSLGMYVGYHYTISHAGVVVKCRAHEDEGAHCIGLNRQSIGICLEGNFNEELPTEEQKASLGKLLVELCQEYKLDVTDIYPHRAFSLTACPGKRLDDSFARVLYLDYKQGDIKLPLPCTPR